ncbi:FAD-dependent oxidoreductase [Anaeromicropila populeti]|uniref:Pyruvate/2-oxoglutarate dehydrogenase complex, dihydrolipoamide dehydrogenase (E3) component n=1 Tax=Anaeromicropila populeti TaxID=37658 RepID=A0A1I6K875_9FIRM|nr:FAD-dependent oxidoreductase [Anaeromicropila populeti]SFR87402.1 Pyruvate/2-oxoglutarate dehydrogenase complex, dihydrolipoamide dehydrogenase (E3) component [Anaeromicropila populeti]
MKIVIIGSIAAGVSAAHKIAAGSPAVKICIYEKGSFYTCGNCGLPHYLNESIQVLEEAVCSKESELKEEGIEAHLNHEVLKIDVAAKQLTVYDLSNDRTFTDCYDKLIIATGSRNLIPNVPGADKVGVQVFKSVEDLIFLKEYTKTPYVKDICILGGSYGGLELAKAFLKLKRNVRIVEKENKLLPDFDAEVSDKIQNELMEEGVLFSMGETVQRFNGRTFVDELVTTGGTYNCDLCIVAIGVKPNSEIVADTGIALDADGAILIDENLETSVKDIYAVGDCAACKKGTTRTSSIRVADLEIARTGLTEEEAKRAGIRVKSVTASGNDRPGICPNPNKVTIKLIYDAGTRKVIGAQAWGKKNASARMNAIAVAICAGMTVEQLGEVDFVYSSSSSAIWDPVQIVCNAAK